MGGEERVARQHATGRLTVRERIDRLLRRRQLPRDRRAGRARHLRRRRRARPTSCPRTWSSATGGSTAAARSSRATTSPCAAARPTPRSGRSRVWAERAAHELRLPLVRLVDGTGGGGSVKTLEDDGLHLRAAAARAGSMVVENLATVPVVAAALGPGRRPRRGARRGLALLGDRARHRAAVRRRAAGRGGGDGRVARQGGARRRPRPDPRRRGRQRGRRRGGRVRPDPALPLLPAAPACGRPPPVLAARPTPPTAREEELLGDRPARSAHALQRSAALLDAGARPRLGLRARRPLRRARSITALARLDGPPGRRARLRPRALRRRPDRRRVGQARPLRRPVRPVPPAGRRTSSTSPAS